MRIFRCKKDALRVNEETPATVAVGAESAKAEEFNLIVLSKRLDFFNF